MSNRIDARDLASLPSGTRFSTPDSRGSVYTLIGARYGAGRVVVTYTEGEFHTLGLSTIFLED